MQRALDIGSQGGLSYKPVESPPFILASWRRIVFNKGGVQSSSDNDLFVYIEGDGAAWINGSQVSPDPTPSNPLALKLAVIDAQTNPNKQILYLARPCQFVHFSHNPSCKSFYWSTGRYSEAVISSMDGVIGDVAKEAGSQHIYLVGYSGGAAAAMLIAARRRDVRSIRSVAGNVDPEGLNRAHGVSPLADSLNPRHFSQILAGIPQIYWVGGGDSLITSEFTSSWIKRLSSGCVTMVELAGVGHAQGWDTAWPMLLNYQMPTGSSCSRSQEK